jgi:hypothetical protein
MQRPARWQDAVRPEGLGRHARHLGANALDRVRVGATANLFTIAASCVPEAVAAHPPRKLVLFDGKVDPLEIDRDPKGQLDGIFAIAARHGVGLDIHLHEPGEMGLFRVVSGNTNLAPAPTACACPGRCRRRLLTGDPRGRRAVAQGVPDDRFRSR